MAVFVADVEASKAAKRKQFAAWLVGEVRERIELDNYRDKITLDALLALVEEDYRLNETDPEDC